MVLVALALQPRRAPARLTAALEQATRTGGLQRVELEPPQLRYLATPHRTADFIGRTESLVADVATVFAHLDLPDVEQVPRANASTPRGPYQDFYTEATRRRVAELYAEDVTAFGYTF